MKKTKRTKKAKNTPTIVFYESYDVNGLTENQVNRLCQTIAAMPFPTKATIN